MILFCLALPCHALNPRPIHDLEHALKEAKKQGKLLFIKYGRETCGNCKALKKLIQNRSVKIYLNTFIFADIDCDNETQNNIFFEHFPAIGGTLPFVVITNSEGKMLVSHKGSGTAKDFNDLIRNSLFRISINYLEIPVMKLFREQKMSPFSTPRWNPRMHGRLSCATSRCPG